MRATGTFQELAEVDKGLAAHAMVLDICINENRLNDYSIVASSGCTAFHLNYN